MTRILVQVPESMAQALEKIAPARPERSRFIQLAIQKAIMERQEDQTRDAYRRHPPKHDESWDAPRPKRRPAARKRKTTR